jgi:hypothetical protein
MRSANKIRYLLCSAKFEGTPIRRSPFKECHAHTHALCLELRSRELAGGKYRKGALVAKVAVTTQSVLQTMLPMHILYFARIIDRCARSESMP